MPRTKADARTILSNVDIPTLEALERKILWLSSWMIHNANHVRESRDGLKVGGHQSSCASAATLLTALYLHSLRPEDRVAVKPHAAPVFHAIQYLLGRQDLAKLQDFRALGGINLHGVGRGTDHAAATAGLDDGAPDAQIMVGYAAEF